MKKALILLMAILMTLTLVACNEDTDPVDDGTADGSTELTAEESTDGGNADALDIWNGVEGDAITYTLEVSGHSLDVVLNRDGSCYTYRDMKEPITGEFIGRPELDGVVNMYPTNYGSFEVKDGAVTATLEAQVYYRFVATGKDADALKDAFFEVSLEGNEAYKEGYYGKGVVMDENKGSVVLTCNYDGKGYTVAHVTSYDENNAKLTSMVPNADGSYKETNYYPDGSVQQICEYSADSTLMKREFYGEKGALEYVDTVTLKENGSLMTRTDASGKVLQTEDRISKKYGHGSYYSELTVVKDGVTVYHSINDEKFDAEGFSVSSYSLLEQIEGNRTVRNENYTDCKDAKNNYVSSREYLDGVMVYYYCAIERVTVMEGVEGRQYVRYESSTGNYCLEVEYVDENGSLVGVGYDYAVNEYVHGEWEKFEYVIEN